MESTQQPDHETHHTIVLGQPGIELFPTMSLLVLQAYLRLIRFEVYLARRDFEALHNKVRNYPLAKQSASLDSVEPICSAVDMACIWYWKEVLCLQRSAVTALPAPRFWPSPRFGIRTQHTPSQT